MKILNKTAPFLLGFLFAFVVSSSAELFTNANAEKQPLMRSALIDLKAAERKLENASHDKGGHRVVALKHVRGAISHVRRGIAFDNKY